MNPEGNESNTGAEPTPTPAPVSAPTPESTDESSSAPMSAPTLEPTPTSEQPPSLEQVAADLTSAAANNTLESSEPTNDSSQIAPIESEESNSSSVAAPTSESITSSNSSAEPAPELASPQGSTSPSETPQPAPAPESTVASAPFAEPQASPLESASPTPLESTSPTSIEPASSASHDSSLPTSPDSTSPTTPAEPTSSDSISSTTPTEPTSPTSPLSSTSPTSPTSSESSPTPVADFNPDTTSASSDTPTEQKNFANDEENPLVPADPVPGSIGSALAYSETAPNHAVPVGKPKNDILSLFKKHKSSATPVAASDNSTSTNPTLTNPSATPSDATSSLESQPAPTSLKKPRKENLKLIAIIGIAVVLIAVVAIILLFVINGASSNKSTNTTPTNNQSNKQPTISSLTCTKEGGASVFPSYGNVVSGKEEIIAMYSNNILTSFGSTLNLSYNSLDDANQGQTTAKNSYSQKLSAARLNADPFDSEYNIIDNTLSVSHQADADMITTTNASVLGFYVLQGKIQDDIDTLLDTYEADGYTCVEK